MVFAWRSQQESHGHYHQQDSEAEDDWPKMLRHQQVCWESDWANRHEKEFHGHTLPMRYPASIAASAAKIAAARVIRPAREAGDWLRRASSKADDCC
jgi:hypothetical protein